MVDVKNFEEEITRATIKNKRDIYPTAIDSVHYLHGKRLRKSRSPLCISSRAFLMMKPSSSSCEI